MIPQPRHRLSPVTSEYRAASRQLEEWRCAEFASMVSIVRQHITDKELTKHNGIRLRHAALVRRYAIESARQYRVGADRAFAGLSATQEKALRARFKELKVDAFMRATQERIAAQNAAIITLIPDRRSRRRARLVSLLPYEVTRHHLGDPSEEDLAQAELVEAEWPDARPLTAVDREREGAVEEIWIGRLVLTRTRAYVVGWDQKPRGVYQDDLGHPFDGLPLVGVRLEASPERGCWLPPLAGDVFTAQVALSVGPSDAEHQVRELASGLSILSGPGASKIAKRIARGPNNMLVVDATMGAEGAAQFAHHTTAPAVASYLDVLDREVSMLGSYRHQRPDGFKGAASADAMEVQRETETEDRLRLEELWQDVERSVLRLIITWHNSQSALKIPIDTELTVTYRYPPRRRNDLQQAQARAIDYALGLRDPADDVDTRGVVLGLAERRELVRANTGHYLAWRASMGEHVPAGLDAIGTWMGLAGARAPATADGAPPPPEPEG